MGEIEKDKSVSVQRIHLPPLMESNISMGFFDGASQNGDARCGARAVLKCQDMGVFRIKMNCDQATNSRGELLALWSIFFFSFQASYLFATGGRFKSYS